MKEHPPKGRLAGILAAGIAPLLAAYYFFPLSKIADHSLVNLPLPDDFTRRIVYRDSAAVRDDIADLTGRVITIEQDGRANKNSERLIVPGPTPTVERVSDGVVYESKIDRSAMESAKGTFLESLSHELKAESMLEITISDVASARLSDAQIDWDRLRRFAASYREAAGSRSCFVQAVRLASLTYRAYVKSGTKSNYAAYGDVFVFSGAVYSSSQRHTVDYRISVDCMSIAALKSAAERTGLSSLPDALNEARALAAMRAFIDNRKLVGGQLSGTDLGTPIYF